MNEPKRSSSVILCAQPLDSMTPFARKQHPNAVIGARYPNTVILLVRVTYRYTVI